MTLQQGSVGHSRQDTAKQHLELTEHHCTSPVSQTPFFNIYLLASLRHTLLTIRLQATLTEIKEKENYRQLNKFFCPGNSSVKQDASFLQRKVQEHDRISSSHLFFPLSSLFGGSGCRTLALLISFLIYHIAIRSSQLTPVTIVHVLLTCTCRD